MNPTIQQYRGDVWLDGALLTAAMVCSWGLCYLLLVATKMSIYDSKSATKIEKPTLGEKLDAADGLFCIPYFFLLLGFALVGTHETGGTLELRWQSMTWATYWFQQTYVTRMLMHMPIQWVTLASNPTLRLQMSAHHALSVLCFGYGLMCERMHYFAVLDGCCEVTTCFLNAIFVLKALFPPNSVDTAIALSGVCLWSTFIVFRLALFPYWLYVFFTDATYHPAETWDNITVLEKWMYPSVTCFLLVLSANWMVPITKGMLKALGLTKPKKED